MHLKEFKAFYFSFIYRYLYILLYIHHLGNLIQIFKGLRVMGLDIVEIFKNIFIFSCCETSNGRLKKMIHIQELRYMYYRVWFL